MILKLVEYKLPSEAAGRKSESVNELLKKKKKNRIKNVEAAELLGVVGSLRTMVRKSVKQCF